MRDENRESGPELREIADNIRAFNQCSWGNYTVLMKQQPVHSPAQLNRTGTGASTGRVPFRDRL